MQHARNMLTAAMINQTQTLDACRVISVDQDSHDFADIVDTDI